MNKELFRKIGVACFGDAWQTELSKRLNITDRSVRKWIKEDRVPSIVSFKRELIGVMQTRIAEIDDAINELLASDNDLELAHQFDKCSDAVRLLKKYYIDMCGCKLFEPSHKNGVFAVTFKNDEERFRLTVLDNHTIVKDDGYGKYKVYTKSDYERDINELYEVSSLLSQDE